MLKSNSNQKTNTNSPFLETSSSTRFSKFCMSGGSLCISLSLNPSFLRRCRRKKFWKTSESRGERPAIVFRHSVRTPYLGKISDVVGVQKELLQAPGVPQNILGHCGQGTVPLINTLDLPVATFEDGYAAEHYSG